MSGYSVPAKPTNVRGETRPQVLLVEDFEALSDRAAWLDPARRAGSPKRIDRDRQGVLSASAEGLRVSPLTRPGWRRAGTSLGPLDPTPGTIVDVALLNGHNSSQTFHIRLPWKKELRRNIGDIVRRRFRLRPLRDNLAVGLSPGRPFRRPSRTSMFLVRSAGPEGGDLLYRDRRGWVAVRAGVPNVPVVYTSLIRDDAVAYYRTRPEGPRGVPVTEPLGVRYGAPRGRQYATFQQAVLGEIGFRADSRVFEARVAIDPSLSSGRALAHVWWEPGTVSDAFESSTALPGFVLSDPGVRSGVVSLRAEGDGDGCAALIRSNADASWWVSLTRTRCDLVHSDHTGSRVVRSALRNPFRRESTLTIIDDGRSLMVTVDGSQRFRENSRQAAGTRVGFRHPKRGRILSFEAHPATLRLTPEAVVHATAPVDLSALRGSEPVLHRRLEGTDARDQGQLLHTTHDWRRDMGEARIVLEPDGARVVGSPARPSPGRTTFSVPWRTGGFADLEVVQTPPGTRRGQGHAGRGGLVFWQDPLNYLIVSVWLDDSPGHDGSSVSSFYRAAGHEDPFQAVWTNVGHSIRWGRRHRLRASCDGRRYAVWLDGEPVLYRALADIRPDQPTLRITRVGIAVNWEYGDDTGTRFHHFAATTSTRKEPRT